MLAPEPAPAPSDCGNQPEAEWSGGQGIPLGVQAMTDPGALVAPAPVALIDTGAAVEAAHKQIGPVLERCNSEASVISAGDDASDVAIAELVAGDSIGKCVKADVLSSAFLSPLTSPRHFVADQVASEILHNAMMSSCDRFEKSTFASLVASPLTSPRDVCGSSSARSHQGFATLLLEAELAWSPQVSLRLDTSSEVMASLVTAEILEAVRVAPVLAPAGEQSLLSGGGSKTEFAQERFLQVGVEDVITEEGVAAAYVEELISTVVMVDVAGSDDD